ncbi:MAG: T9SS type A sorting domain-containing protein [Sphingobacteriales bacterium]|nr:MAG: T9SS type A sorting domain-containing protein [Sphingobacteriales bacterium]
MKKLFYLFGLLYCFPGSAQTVYHVQTSGIGEIYPFGKDSAIATITDIQTKDYRMAAFNLKTMDWRYINSKSFTIRPGQNGIFMRDVKNGISVQHDASVLYTNDGWATANTATGINTYVAGATKAGYYAVTTSGSASTFHFSADGGTWSKAKDQFGLFFTASKENKVVAIRNMQEMVVSYDGGQTYAEYNVPTNQLTNAITNFWLTDTSTYYITEGSNFWRSSNSGTTWTKIQLPTFGYMAFSDAKTGALINSNKEIYFTADSGKTWQLSPNLLPAPNYTKPFYVNGYLYFGNNLRTADNAQTFESFFPSLANIQPYDIDFNKNGFGIISSGGGQLNISKDGGRSFYMQTTKPTGEDMMSVKVLKANTLLAGDRKGQIFISKDMGKTWSQKNTEISNLNAVRFNVSADEKTIVLRRLGQPLISTDGGETFEMNVMGGGNHDQAVSPDGTIYDASNFNNGGFTDSLEIHTVNPANKSKKSILRIFSANTVVSRIHMASNSVGYVLGVNPTTYDVHIFRTDNTWKTASSAGVIQAGPGAYNGLISVFNFGTDTLVMVPHNKNFYHYTTNAGKSWTIDSLRIFGKTVTEKIMGSHFYGFGNYIMGLDNNKLIVNSVVQAKDTTTSSIGANRKSNFRGISLYPNPASNYIHLEVENTIAATQLSAKIYSLDGRLVSELQVNNAQNISVSALEKGMYMLHIYQSGKMLGVSRFVKQ